MNVRSQALWFESGLSGPDNISDIECGRRLTHSPAIVWIVRRIILPFVAGGAIDIGLLLAWLILNTDTAMGFGLRDLALIALFVVPFQAVGLALLVPTALLLCDLSFPKPVYPALLMLVGAALGIVVTLPINDRPQLLEYSLPAICGAISAMIWFLLNRDAIKQRA